VRPGEEVVGRRGASRFSAVVQDAPQDARRGRSLAVLQQTGCRFRVRPAEEPGHVAPLLLWM